MNVLENYWLTAWDNVVVKVWSNLLAWDTSNNECRILWANYCNLHNIVNSVDYLMKLWLNVFLVSSWAVAIWKIEQEKVWIKYTKELTSDEKASLSWIWQITLMSLYRTLFKEKNRIIAQNLLTHDDFLNESRLNDIINVWKQYNKNWVVPIINENDTVSREELWFSDNDELAWLVSKAVNAKILFLLTDVNGLCKNFMEPDQELIREVSDVESVRKYSKWNFEKWSHGTWFMWSKLDVAEKMMKYKILCILAHWWEIGIIKKIMEHDKESKEVVDYTIFL